MWYCYTAHSSMVRVCPISVLIYLDRVCCGKERLITAYSMGLLVQDDRVGV